MNGPTASHHNNTFYGTVLLCLTIVTALGVIILGISFLGLFERQRTLEKASSQNITEQTAAMTAIKDELQKSRAALEKHAALLSRSQERLDRLSTSAEDTASAQKSLKELVEEMAVSERSWQKDYVSTLVKMETKLDEAITEQKDLETKIFLLEENVASKKIDALKDDVQSLKAQTDRLLQLLPLSPEKESMTKDLNPDLFQ